MTDKEREENQILKAKEIINQFRCYRHINKGTGGWVSEEDLPAMKKWATISVSNTIEHLKDFKEGYKDLSISERISLPIALDIKYLEIIREKILNYER